MPHKQNPITAEKICGLAKMARAYVMPITEGVALWHERDISHSSVERIAVPDLCAIAEHVLVETFKLVRYLRVNEAGMRYNTNEGSTFMLNRYIKNGMTRNEAYKAAKSGLRDGSCPPADVQHTWDALSIIKTALNEAKIMNGVSFS